MRATELMGLDMALPELNQMNRKPLFVHDRSRLATATSIRFVGPDRVVAANFAGARLYLLRFDLTEGDWQILDSVDTTFEDQLVTTDLLEVDGAGQIITSNFHRGTASLYRYENDAVEFTRDVDVEFGGYTHGLRFLRPNVVAVAVTRGPTGVHVIDLADHDRRLFHLEIPVKTQDMLVLPDGRLFVILAHGAPKRAEQNLYHSEFRIYDIDIDRGRSTLVDSSILPNAHIDACAPHGRSILLTDQLNDKVVILDRRTLSITGEISGFDFPHGIDTHRGLMAVTNYGDNTVSIRRVGGRFRRWAPEIRRQLSAA